MNDIFQKLTLTALLAATAALAEDKVPLKTEWPKPLLSINGPMPINMPDVEPEHRGPRPDFLVPAGCKNLAKGKKVTTSDDKPLIGALGLITDGDKNGDEGSWVELGPGTQWVQIDLKEESDIYALLVWHFHGQKRIYFDVVVQVSDDPTFEKGITTVFNADANNELGFGAGTNQRYIESYQGKLIDAKGVKARYVRLYSKGNTMNKMNHYIEAEVWGKQESSSSTAHTFAIGTNDFLLDGQRLQIRCGEIHAARVPAEYWRHRLQIAKAMGLNTVCAYLFWNLHEPKPGEYVWTGQADDAQFCRIAQEEGLWVILRPGPYACAEWEMGGTPWWLLKNDDIKLRSRDPHYINAVKSYLKEVGRVLGPLQITHGGPIIMAQVENEYGFFGNDAGYMNEIRNALIDAGFDVPLFACNPPDMMKSGLLTNLFQAGNFGSDVVKNFEKVRKIQPTGPLICSEFYPGWFDTWGQPHHTGKPENYLPNLKLMLDMDASFSIYMAHGGTTFGLWSGCDRPFKPDTSSYDYDAPISEAGWATPKFFQTRELFAKYLLPGEKLPAPPAANPVVSFASVELKEVAPIFENLPAAVKDETPRNMEAYDQGYGCILYRTKIPTGAAATLEAAAIHDFGYVFLDGRRVGILDRRSPNAKIVLPERKQDSQLDILVEPMGRVNFGPEMADRKGLIAPVKLGGETLKGWEIFNLPLDDKMLGGLKFQIGNRQSAIGNQPAFWRGTFTLNKAGDTFLDLHNWGKGDLWVNGHCLGRYWNIGPTQTAYAPGCWLRAGENEIVILDTIGSETHTVAGLEKPVLDELRPEKDFAQAHRPVVKLNLDAVKPAHTGTFAPGGDTQEIKFAAPATGKFFCLESRNAQDGKPYAAVAELDLLDASGNAISHNGWTIAYVDSEEHLGEDGAAENAIDGQTANFWHTEWKNASPDHPHRLILNLGQPQTISGFRYVPRQGEGGGGRIKSYRIFIGDALVQK